MGDHASAWIALAVSVVGAIATIAVVWGYNKKTLESVEKSNEKHGTALDGLMQAFVAFREEVRVRLAVSDAVSGMRQAVRGPAPHQPPAPTRKRPAKRKPARPARTYRVPPAQ